MKVMKWFTLWVVLVVMLVGCERSPEVVDQNLKWADNGLYFVKWDAYQGYFEDEEPTIKLFMIQVHNGKLDDPLKDYMKFSLLDGKNEFPVTLSGAIPEKGKGNENYSLYTVDLKLPKLDHGKYKLSQLKLVSSNGNEEKYDIGTWRLDVRTDENRQDVKIGKKAFLMGEFKWYIAEIMNNKPNDVCIRGFEYELGTLYKTTIETSESFDDRKFISNQPCITVGKSKTYKFNFTPQGSTEPPKFVSLRPILSYEIGSNNYLSELPTAMYFNPNLDDKQVSEIVKGQN